MNILFISINYPSFGGIEKVTDTLINHIGKNHCVYSLSWNMNTEAVIPEYLQHYFTFESKDIEGKIKEYNRLTESLNIDLVINQGMFPINTSIIFNRYRDPNVKVISILHAMPGYEKIEYMACRKERKKKNIIRNLLIRCGLHGGYNQYCKLFSHNHRIAAENSAKIVLLSQSYIPLFIKTYSLQKYAFKICAIPNPVPSFAANVPECEWHDKENIMLFVGRLSLEKRVDIILSIWNRLSKTQSIRQAMESWKLLIVGDGPSKTHLENTADEMQLRNCIFTGNSTNVNEYYSKAKIILLTSMFEGFPMCLLEAQKFGCVPVSFDISGGVRDILENGSGIIVKQNDIEGMTAKVAELITDESLLQDLSEKAVSNTSRFSLDKVCQMWDDLISTCR